ncbi:histidine kinase N-terminal domain-containing protein [Halalkalibacter akibai]|uniref:histidine kinase n=1 Tax=Halalkalibacter akibai (strain ATCC 43226 / DSM 21942 / CIP 109018 / JCM 9157 / 1139) TaxID=1236973 RepID=W4QNS3_HALA3|nr:histidine kinase N-terminal domain-containing protein [Halalkalibacter akibai]GAE33318.1 sensor histidine kinase [Halalkalibacter akibai JCM 9157]
MKTIETHSHFRDLYDYLELNKMNFLEEWQGKIKLDPHDRFKEKVTENGQLMYELISHKILNKTIENQLEELAFIVAHERVAANINIGDFVYNVNIGRSILVKYILNSGVTPLIMNETICSVNELFDHFCYNAVTKYTEIKNDELQEKKLFINQSHKDKLAILGQMSSSFVHEFRNPLTSIIGFNKLLRNEYPNLKYLDIIEMELDQLKFRITQFLHTSKMDIVGESKRMVNIKLLIEDILQFLYPSFADVDIKITLMLDDNLQVEANKDELKQVFVNVLMNSVDALRQKEKPREIKVSAENSFEEEIKVTIANNGPAIPLSVRETIFEPFFTTKDLGTGIGLYVCRNIIEKHNGSLDCLSNDQETTFLINLPMKTL